MGVSLHPGIRSLCMRSGFWEVCPCRKRKPRSRFKQAVSGPGWHMERKSEIIYLSTGFPSHGPGLRAGIQTTEATGKWGERQPWGFPRKFQDN